MIEKKLIPTITTLSTTLTNFSIKTFYKERIATCGSNTFVTDLPYTLSSFIGVSDGTINGIAYQQGQLVIDMINNPQQIDFSIDSNGNLIVVGDDSNSYYIDSNGDLIYDDCLNLQEFGIGEMEIGSNDSNVFEIY